jgi:predicted aspartyl protease
MTLATEQKMGRFSVEVEVTNDEDVYRANAGIIPQAEIRRARVRGVVDTGATRLVIPEALADQLGLGISGTTQVRYGDGQTAERAIVQRIRLAYGGRESIFSAIVEPGRESILVGAIVLDELDFVVDCIAQRLVPRDPNQIISEVE